MLDPTQLVDWTRNTTDLPEDVFQALAGIANICGNLPDDSLTDRTGPNDAAHRGIMATCARRIARECLEKHVKAPVEEKPRRSRRPKTNCPDASGEIGNGSDYRG